MTDYRAEVVEEGTVTHGYVIQRWPVNGSKAREDFPEGFKYEWVLNNGESSDGYYPTQEDALADLEEQI